MLYFSFLFEKINQEKKEKKIKKIKGVSGYRSNIAVNMVECVYHGGKYFLQKMVLLIEKRETYLLLYWNFSWNILQKYILWASFDRKRFVPMGFGRTIKTLVLEIIDSTETCYNNAARLHLTKTIIRNRKLINTSNSVSF